MALKEIWVPVSAAIAQQRQVESIANNIANVNTPGFKKDTLVFKEKLAALERGISNDQIPNEEWSPEDFYHHHGAEQAFVDIDGSYTKHTQGSLRPTRNALDVALKGPGFFEVLTPNGVRYTRNGIFALSPKGELITQDGNYVLSPINKAELQGDVPQPALRKIVLSNNKKVSISPSGQIFQNNQEIAKLSMTEFKNIHALRKQGNSLYNNSDNENIKTTIAATKSLQGFVEQSNVNPILEMSELLKAHRHFESIQKAIKAYDNISGKAINELSKY